MSHPVIAMSCEKEDYFVPSPFCIPLPDGEMEDLLLPESMIEECVSKRLRHHRPFYRIPHPPLSTVWQKKENAEEGYRLLVHRCYVTLKHTTIVHDYLHIRKKDALGGWIQKYAAYYHKEKELLPYDEYRCESLETKEVSSSPSPSILSSCSSSLPCPQPIRPRVIKRVKPVPVQVHPLS